MASEWSGAAVRASIAAGAVPSTANAFVLNSCSIEQAVLDCRGAFPAAHFMHAFAVKANPLSCVLDLVVRNGMALETASIAEFEAARRALERAHLDSSRIVFDSPAKTLEELQIAVYSRCYLNVDNFQELERIAQLHAQQPVTASIGIRINPQVGAGDAPHSLHRPLELAIMFTRCGFSHMLQEALPLYQPVFPPQNSGLAWMKTARP